MSRYVVIGGGVSGLAAARVLAGAQRVGAVAAAAGSSLELSGKGDDHVVVLEASARAGGKVLTGSLAALRIDLGPDQFLRRDPSAERLCRLLGLGEALVTPSVSNAAVFSYDRARPLPAGLVLGIPTDLPALSSSGIVSKAACRFATSDSDRPGPVLEAADVGLHLDGSDTPSRVERSAGAILRPRLGDEIVDRLVDPLIGGINAGSIDDLSLGTVAPQIARALIGHHDVIAPLRSAQPPRRYDSPFFGLVGGLGRLVTAVTEELSHLGCDVKYGCAALRIRLGEPGAKARYVVDTIRGSYPADGVVVALPAGQAASVLKDIAPKAAGLLATVGYGSVAVVTFSFDRELPRALEGLSGVLVPRVEGTLMTALTLLSQKWPWTTEKTPLHPLVRVSAGRHLDSRIDTLSDDDLCRSLATELTQLLGLDAKPTGCLLQRWPQAFPQYVPGHSARIGLILRALGDQPGIAMAGATLGGVGVPACISSGELAADQVRLVAQEPT